MRALLTYSIGCFGIVGVFALALASWISTQNAFAFPVVMVIGIAALIWVGRKVQVVGRVDMNPWLASVDQCTFKYAWDGFGIALDDKARAIHLTQKTKAGAVSKTYGFADVREWGYEMPGATVMQAGRIIGGGMDGATDNLGRSIGAGMSNAASAQRALDGTGLWLNVRDIEHPRWFVRFQSRRVHDPETEAELRRWMEILKQHINER